MTLEEQSQLGADISVALNTPDTSLDGLTEDQLRAGLLRLIQFNGDDEAVAADDARIAAEAKAARKLAKKAAKQNA